MTKVFRFLALLLSLYPPASYLLLADPGSDAVNERIPVNKAELEAHWRVDCNKVWQLLDEARLEVAEGGSCKLSSVLRGQLQMCVFIYQPPGDEPTGHCPDYERVLNGMPTDTEHNWCAGLSISMKQSVDCGN